LFLCCGVCCGACCSFLWWFCFTGTLQASENEPVVVVVVASKETKEELNLRLSAAAEKVRLAEAAAAEGGEDVDTGKKDKKDKKKGGGKKDKKKKGGEDDAPEVAGAFDPGSVVLVYEVWPREPMFVPVASLTSSTTVTSVQLSRGSQYIAVTTGSEGTVDVYALPPRPVSSLNEVNNAANGANTSHIAVAPPSSDPLPEVPEGDENLNGGDNNGDEGLPTAVRSSRPRSELENARMTLHRSQEGAVSAPYPVPPPQKETEGGENGEKGENGEGGEGGEGGESGPGITLEKRLQWALPPPSVTFCVEASQNDQQSSLAENGGVNSLVVFWPTTNVLKKYMLGEEAAEEEVEEDTGDTGETGESTLTEQQEQRAAAALVWVWYAPSAITVTATDARHEYYCVGTSDGSVFVLNIQTGIPFAVPRRHVSPKGQVRKRGVACLGIIEHYRPVIDQ